MIDTVLFDMGGTLEDIWVDDESRHSSIQGVLDILHAHGIDLNMDFETAAQSINAGWERYGAYRDPRQRELKPEEIWGSFVLTDFGLNEDSVRPYAEELAHMWEITHYHRTLRPHVKEMLEGLKGLGMKLGVISNTASLYQVFDVLKGYGIRDYFQDVTLSSVTGYRKPDPNIFLVSLHQVQSDPRQLCLCGRYPLPGRHRPHPHGLRCHLPHRLLPHQAEGHQRSRRREAHLQREGHLRGLHDSEGRPLIPVLMYDKKCPDRCGGPGTFCGFQSGCRSAVRQRKYSRFRCLFRDLLLFRTFPVQKSRREYLLSAGFLTFSWFSFLGGRFMPEAYSYRVPAPSTMAS